MHGKGFAVVTVCMSSIFLCKRYEDHPAETRYDGEASAPARLSLDSSMGRDGGPQAEEGAGGDDLDDLATRFNMLRKP